MQKVRVGLVYWLLLSTASFLGADTIYFKKGGNRSKVKVSNENYQFVEYITADGKNSKYKSEIIDWVEYSDSPQSFLEGRSALLKGNYEEAAKAFREAIATDIDSQWLDIYGSFFLAETYRKWADANPSRSKNYQNAIEHYNISLRKNPEHRLFYEQMFSLAYCLWQNSEYDEALSYLQRLENKSQENKVEKWVLKAILGQGNIAKSKKDFNQALDLYKKAGYYAKRQSLPEHETFLAIGDCYTKKGNFSQAIEHYESLKKEAAQDNWELQVGIENGLAASYLAQGEIVKAKSIATKTLVEYYQGTKEKAHTLFLLGQCYEKLEAQDKEARKKSLFYYSMLEKGYPGNTWTMEAVKRIREISYQE